MKESESINVIVDGLVKVTLVSAVQLTNALLPIFMGPDGIIILVNVSAVGPVKPVTVVPSGEIVTVPTLIYTMNNIIGQLQFQYS